MLRDRPALLVVPLAIASIVALARAAADRDARLIDASGEASVREVLEQRIAVLEAARAEDEREAHRRAAVLQSELELARARSAQFAGIAQELASSRQALLAAEARLAEAGAEVLVRDAGTGMILTIRSQKGAKLAVERLAELEGLIRIPDPSSRATLARGGGDLSDGQAPLNQGVTYAESASGSGQGAVEAPGPCVKSTLQQEPGLNQGVGFVDPRLEGGPEEGRAFTRTHRGILTVGTVEVVPSDPSDHPQAR